jgi:SSS family solute:Na+ symporter
MTTIDWITTAIPLLIVLGIGVYSQQYIKSVADFISANRSAGRYLLCIAGGELQAGAVVFVAAFEVFGKSGFSLNWWNILNIAATLILSITGFVIYRYRETRAMTLAQFFEIRYNKSFRVFTGALGFFAGILNFGVIPAIGARVMVYFLGLPETVRIFSMTVPTYVPLMALFLTITVFVAVSGGVITVMMVNTMEGILSQVFYLIIIFAVLTIFSWSQMNAVLIDRPPGQSLINPFDSFSTKDFNLWFVLMLVWATIYGRMAWQNASAYYSAGLTAHEGRMAGILTSWRDMGKNAVITFLALAALTYLHHPSFAAGAAHVEAAVRQIADPQAREQMEAPIALSYLLPIGVRGVFCAILLMGIFGGDATHLHSWGSIFVQDVLVPLRKKPFGTRAHLWALRCSIFGVACFAFFFGTVFHLVDYINMWWLITQMVFVGGAGSAIIGGLYWKKGTAAAAWAAFITGSILSVGGIIAQQIDKHYYNHDFFLNGAQMGFFASLIAVCVYVVTSLLTCREDFNLDRMLHRGEYASIKKFVGDAAIEHKEKIGWGKIIGMDDNFTLGDKWITVSLFGWNLLWLGLFVVISAWSMVSPLSTEWWSAYCHYTSFYLPIFFAVATGIWFTWGGIKDMRLLFRRLRHQQVNALDDGTVVNNQNLDERAVENKLHKTDVPR